MPKAYLSWENCELAQLIVKKEDVWAGKINPVPVLLNQDQKKPSKKNPSSSTTTTTDNTATQDNNQSLVLNFGLDENEHQKAILFDGLPKIKELLKIKNKPIFDPSDFSTPSSSDPEEATSKMGSEEDEEDLKKLRLMRICHTAFGADKRVGTRKEVRRKALTAEGLVRSIFCFKERKCTTSMGLK
ncbi:hypothetical protein PSHT_00973 [Puccinia striiformis]|uniref:Uncharacterized protein n=2 Tax=Puccinia striiformis TaxID=27350 RepID=A0A0L0V881_9BASI|nr:hypothetical protein Pst134EB_010952 [Puccinia striiformis f. sp. tritici]KNE95209.1 hypothetical protein PSTG_11474 [Puccinia striiformis f. sp. tritici PST-78]POW22711.1 hypothetical protein PSHT_00973 [Puccinia striiformis]